MKKLLVAHPLFFVCLILFCMLLFKDIFSERTLIPNFEPFPDSIYYVNTARSFVAGYGLNIVREGRILTPIVPPLYPLVLVPVYLINIDARMFYFTNIILTLLSFFLFYLILIRVVKSSIIKTFILFLYITNYDLYWFPNLAMAENLILPLFLLNIYILFAKVTRFNIILSGILGMSFYATKYASVPIAASLLFVYGVKLLTLKVGRKIKIINIAIFLSTAFFMFIIFGYYEYKTKGVFPLSYLVNFGSSLNTSNSTEVRTLTSFSVTYIQTNFRHYLNSITGGSERFLWDLTPILPRFVAIGGLIGLILGLFSKQFRFISFVFLLIISSSVLFMSTFYSVDMRYIFQIIPTLLLGFGILLVIILEKYKKRFFNFSLLLIISLLFLFYGLTSLIRIKSQISLNLKYVETPWYYVSVLQLNKYFSQDKILNGKKPVVISPMAPYYIDFFSNGNYTLLPLSTQQEFRGMKEFTWGPNDYSDLIKLYRYYIQNGYQLYVARYGLGNETNLNADFQNIADQFRMIQVSEGCFGQCNIYKLNLKTQTE